MNPPTPKHQIYFDKADYIKILQDYEDFQISSHTQQQLLLVAKAYYIHQLYSECISILNRLTHNNKAKVLWEKQALLFKATYLVDYTQTDKLIKILNDFQSSKRFVTDQSFDQYHLQVFKEWRGFVGEELTRFIGKLPKSGGSEQERVARREGGEIIREREKQLEKEHKIQGFPCFLVDKRWRLMLENFYTHTPNVLKTKNTNNKTIYIQQDPQHPGPITNFPITNHIFQIIPHTHKSQQFMDTVLFPGGEYEVVSKTHWAYLMKVYGGLQVKRVYGLNVISKFVSEVTFDERMMLKVLIASKDDTSKEDSLAFIQTPTLSLWPHSILPLLYQHYGLGQLKHPTIQNNHKLVGTGRVFSAQQPTYRPFKYITFEHHSIHQLTPEDTRFMTSMYQQFDFQAYDIEESLSKGLVGLTNDKLMCYMNSTLQCLSHTYELSRYFLSNSHVDFLNFTKSNTVGSRGQITCAYADIVKKIWTLYSRSQRDAEISPSVFKQVFAKRFEIFMEDSQEDAHQFLNFLLNCMHDDLNRNTVTNPSSKPPPTLPKTSSNLPAVHHAFTHSYQSTNSSIITQLFKGYTYSTLKCLTCQAKYYNFDMHLTIPLPIPSSSSSILLWYLNSWEVESEAVRYTVHLDNVVTVADLVLVVDQFRGKQWKRRIGNGEVRTMFYVLAIDKVTYKVENYYDMQTKITKLVNSKGKLMFFLYEVSKNNTNPYQPSSPVNSNPNIRKHIDIEIDSFDDLSHNQQDSTLTKKKLTLIEYLYEEQRMGYPKLMYADVEQQDEDRLFSIVAESLNDMALNYSGAVATQREKLQCIDKVKLQKGKGKPFVYVIKAKLAKRVNLSKQKERHEIFGETKQAQFTLQNCFSIFGEKDRILEEQGWVCAKCKNVSDCEKEQKIHSVGSHLIIVLKRFKQQQKVCTRIQYPLQGLDMGRFISNENNPTTSNTKPSSLLYDLYGVIVHRGSLNRGHYYSYCKNDHNNKWYLFDDELVREEDDVGVVVDQNAYILFYKRRE